MKLASALLLVVALCHLAPPAAADPGGGAAPLDLDAEEVIAAPTPDFTIPIKVNGQEVECGYWKGQDPADVAIEFGSLHQLDGKKISRLRKAIAAEAETRGLLDTEPAPAPTQVVPAETSAPDRSRPGAHALSITRFQDKWAKMQVATIQFAHSPFCQKFCTKENGGVMGVAVAIAIINAVWAMMVSCPPRCRTLHRARVEPRPIIMCMLWLLRSATSVGRTPSRRSSRAWRRKSSCAGWSRRKCFQRTSRKRRRRL
jgi:hypothetical protein